MKTESLQRNKCMLHQVCYIHLGFTTHELMVAGQLVWVYFLITSFKGSGQQHTSQYVFYCLKAILHDELSRKKKTKQKYKPVKFVDQNNVLFRTCIIIEISKLSYHVKLFFPPHSYLLLSCFSSVLSSQTLLVWQLVPFKTKRKKHHM